MEEGDLQLHTLVYLPLIPPRTLNTSLGFVRSSQKRGATRGIAHVYAH